MRYLTLLIGLVLSTLAMAQTTQPAKLTDLFKPYEDRMRARIAEMPNVPTDAQMAACKADCERIGDEFEQASKLQYVWYAGFVNFKQTQVRWGHGGYESSPRELAMGKSLHSRGDVFTVTYSKPLPAGRGELTIIDGQVLQAHVSVVMERDSIKNGRTDISTIAAYPTLSVYLNAGNGLPMTAKIP